MKYHQVDSTWHSCDHVLLFHKDFQEAQSTLSHQDRDLYQEWRAASSCSGAPAMAEQVKQPILAIPTLAYTTKQGKWWKMMPTDDGGHG